MAVTSRRTVTLLGHREDGYIAIIDDEDKQSYVNGLLLRPLSEKAYGRQQCYGGYHHYGQWSL